MNTKLTTLVVDDVLLARQRVIRALQAHADVEVVGEAEDGAGMVEAIERLRPDLVLLDISMPEQDGFSALLAVPEPMRPLVIFLTAYSEHALRAFRVNAVDYLVKPLDPQALAEALNRVRQRRGLPAPAATAGSSTAAPASHPQRLSFKTSDGLTVLASEDIVWLEAVRNYVAVHAVAETVIVRSTLAGVLERLDPAVFVRIHRSAVVNVLKVQQVQALSNGDQRLRLSNAKELVVSRGYRQELLDRIVR